MANIKYIKAKFSEIARQGEIAIAKSINERGAEAARVGALGDSRYRLIVHETLRNGFQETLENMARLTIDLRAADKSKVATEFVTTANHLARTVTNQHRIALYGSAAFDSGAEAHQKVASPKLIEELLSLTTSILEDAKHGIVGHARYGAVTSEVFSIKPAFLGFSVDINAALRSSRLKFGIAASIALILMFGLIFSPKLDLLSTWKDSNTTWPALNSSEMSRIQELLQKRTPSSVFIACSQPDCRKLANSFSLLLTQIGWPHIISDGGFLATGVTGLLIKSRRRNCNLTERRNWTIN